MPEEGVNCEEHGRKITELDTTVSNAKWMIAIVAGILGTVLSFTGWVANDNLSGIRGDLKEVKGMFQTIQRDTDRLTFEVAALKAWRMELETKGGE